MATKSMKSLVKQLMQAMQEEDLPPQCVNFVVDWLNRYAAAVVASPLSGRERKRIVQLEDLQKLKVGEFRIYHRSDINPQSVRNAASTASKLLAPKLFICNAIGDQMHVHRVKDRKMPKGWVSPREAPIELPKLPQEHHPDCEFLDGMACNCGLVAAG
jgi:hypothetical protein